MEVTAFTSSDYRKTDALKLGAHTTFTSRDPKAIETATGRFGLILSTVNFKPDWNLNLSTLKSKGRLDLVGATLELSDIGVYSLIGAQRTVSGSLVGSPPARHDDR